MGSSLARLRQKASRYFASVVGIDGKQHEEVVLLQRVNQRPLGKFEADRNGAALEAPS